MNNATHQELAAAKARIRELEELLAQATAFDIGNGLVIKRCPVMLQHWVVYKDEWQVLTLDGKWIYEPSRRHHWTDDYLVRTRFDTLSQALTAAKATEV
jgi:hypothetical protein